MVTPRNVCGNLTETKYNTSTITNEKTNISGRKVVSEVNVESAGFDRDTVILIASWKKDTSFSYSVYTSEWFMFSCYGKVSPVEPPVQIALASMTLLVR